MPDSVLHVTVIGASGYTGAEVIRFLLQHPQVKISQLVAHQQAGQEIAAVFPHLDGFGLPKLISLDAAEFDNCDVVFCCLPHGTTQAAVVNLPQHLKIIDLSADFRLHDIASYEQWYGHAHKAPFLQKEAVYGLTEFFRDHIAKARIIACPGCYPTASILPLVPLLQRQAISAENIIIDAKSGISGAGRSASVANLFSETHNSVRAYNIGKHRHIPEIEQTLSAVALEKINVEFTPHVVPMSRGMLATIYVRLADKYIAGDLHSLLASRYESEAFVNVLPI